MGRAGGHAGGDRELIVQNEMILLPLREEVGGGVTAAISPEKLPPIPLTLPSPARGEGSLCLLRR
jgi:hypothetical protein